MTEWTVQYKNVAKKDLAKLPKRILKRVRDAIANLANDPRPRGYKKMKDEKNTYRIRIGDYRVVYEIHKKEIIVLIVRIRHRKESY